MAQLNHSLVESRSNFVDHWSAASIIAYGAGVLGPSNGAILNDPEWPHPDYYAPAAVGKAEGAINVAFVRPSVAYIANNSRTNSMPKFGRKVSHFRCDSHTSFNAKRSMLRVTRSINADTHRAHIFRMAKPTNFKLGVRMEDDDPHGRISRRRHDLQG